MNHQKIFKKNADAGFSLVELMIVVGIIGVLAALAVPRFQQFQAKARMAEAKTMLSSIYALEEAWHLDNNSYQAFALYGRQATGANNCTPDAAADALGFTIDPCTANSPTPRYGYSVTTTANDVFTASAATGANANNLVCPGAPAHQFDMTQDRSLFGPFPAGGSQTAAVSCRR